MNQCKRLSNCPADRLAQCRGQAVQARCDALQGLLNKADQRIDQLTHPAPVPPAGDVECAICLSLGDQCVTCEESEFKAWAEKHFASPDYSQTSAGVYIKDWMRHSFAAWQARSNVVTRLTAERGRLQGDKDRAEAMLKRSVMVEDFQALQSELTKARELSPINWTDRQVLDFLGVALRNVDLVGEVRLSEIRQGFQYMQERQYAPAAKGEADE